MRTVIAPAALALALIAAGCRSSPSRATSEAGSPAVSAVPSAGAAVEVQRFGDAIQRKAKEPLQQVLEKPAAFQGRTVVVEGEVRRACSRKGCWMELAAGKEAAAPGCRVTFKDYGFFVPTDSAGASARVQAAVEVAKLDRAYVDHMEQEGARFTHKNPDGTAEEVRLVASGVELWR